MTDAQRFRRRTAGLCLLAAPAFVLASELASPNLSEHGRASLAVVATETGRLRLWVWLGMVAAVLLIPAVAGLVGLLRDRGVTLGHAGAALATIGAVGYAAHQALFLDLPTLVAGDRGQMAALYERQASYGEAGVLIFLVFLIPLFLGLILLTAALRRARVVPVWPAVAIAAGLLPALVPLPFDAGWVSFLGLLVGLGWCGVALLRRV